MSNESDDADLQWMRHAIDVARRGQGAVEPNPMVGCVLIKDGQLLAEGWHEAFGQAHAEVNALKQVSGQGLSDVTMYVTLEPCSHQGKTPPCSQTVVQSGIRRVVIAMQDPFPEVDGSGITQLKEAGIEVTVGVAKTEAQQLNAPYIMKQTQHRPWIIGKWAMTLDGKIATRSGSSQWISNEQSRAIVHDLRGRVDAVMVGHQTALDDDPQLTARPTGMRTASRVVVASKPALSLESNLVTTAHNIPVIVTAGPNADSSHIERLRDHGVDVWESTTDESILPELLNKLAKQGCTNVLVEGGAELLGSLMDQQLLDEAHVFIASKLVGSSAAPSPIGGLGIEQMGNAFRLSNQTIQTVGDDVYIKGIVRYDKAVDV